MKSSCFFLSSASVRSVTYINRVSLNARACRVFVIAAVVAVVAADSRYHRPSSNKAVRSPLSVRNYFNVLNNRILHIYLPCPTIIIVLTRWLHGNDDDDNIMIV